MSNLQGACGQQPVVQQQTTLPQNQIYQSPIYQGPVYQSPSYYPNQGRVIQTQPAPAGRIYQSPTGGVQTVPPVAQRVRQPSQPDAQQVLDAEKAAYNAEKLALVEKLLEKYKASAAENQGAIKQLGSLKDENAKLVKQMSEFDQTTRDYQTQIRGLQAKLSSADQADPAMLQKTKQLEADYQEAINQVRDLESEVKKLSSDETSRLQQIATLQSTNLKLKSDMEAAQKQATNSMPAESNQAEVAELAEKFRKLTADKQALEQVNLDLQGSSTTLRRQYQDLNEQKNLVMGENLKLKDRIAELAANANNNLNSGADTEVASIASAPPAAVSKPAVNVSSYEAKISQLTRKNRQLSESNSDFKDENRSLSRQLASLKNQSGQAAVDESASTIATALPAALPAVAASAAGNESGWGVLAWLIPFLAIGLGIAFFVIIKEELHRSPSPEKNSSNRRD